MSITNKRNIPKPTFFGKNLKFLRKLSAVSQQQLANTLGVKRNNIAAYESGLVEPNSGLFLKICTHFDIAPSAMLSKLLMEESLDSVDSAFPQMSTDKLTFLKSQIEPFVQQTNEMTKIYEGYTALVELKSTKVTDPTTNELYASFSDIIDLLKTIIDLNWEMIQDIVPYKPPQE